MINMRIKFLTLSLPIFFVFASPAQAHLFDSYNDYSSSSFGNSSGLDSYDSGGLFNKTNEYGGYSGTNSFKSSYQNNYNSLLDGDLGSSSFDSPTSSLRSTLDNNYNWGYKNKNRYEPPSDNSLTPKRSSGAGSYYDLNWNFNEKSNQIGETEYYKRATDFDDGYKVETHGRRYELGGSLYDNSSSYTNEGENYSTYGRNSNLGNSTYHNYKSYGDINSSVWGRTYKLGESLYSRFTVTVGSTFKSIFCRTSSLFSRSHTTCN